VRSEETGQPFNDKAGQRELCRVRLVQSQIVSLIGLVPEDCYSSTETERHHEA
jgi:hypothetical protein